MNKKYLAVIVIALLALTFSTGCVEQPPSTVKTENATQQPTEQQAEDNLVPALQELDELEGLGS